MRSSTTLGQASGDSTGGRALVGKQIVDGPVPQIREQSVEVIKVILQEQCQRMCLFTFERRVVEQLLTGVFGGLWFACKGTSDSTGGRAHNPLPPSV